MNIKDDFPIFKNHPTMVFLDSTSTTHKPTHVIHGIKKYLETDYANIHRGAYDIAETSEKLYIDSKKKAATLIGADDWKEIIYTLNSTYAANILASSIGNSDILQKGDVILVSIAEHHANIVPWQILCKQTGAEIQFIDVKDDYSFDMEDFEEKLSNPKVKIVSITHVSNVTGQIFPLKQIAEKTHNHTNSPYFFVDASQSVPHFSVDVQDIDCDALFFTAHKMMADSGLGILYGKKAFLESLNPSFSGGGAISWVHTDGFKPAPLPNKFEPGTPNVSGAVSFLYAIEYIESIGGYEAIKKIEQELVEYFLEKLADYSKVTLMGGNDPESRVGVFSINVEGIHALDLADFFAERNICVRAGQHCAEPLLIDRGITANLRISFYIYNTKQDIDTFFQALDDAIELYT